MSKWDWKLDNERSNSTHQLIMNKTKNILLSTLGIILIGSGFYYYKFTQSIKYPLTTGGDKPQNVPLDVNIEPDAMAKLGKLLPLQVEGFTITFNYSKGKYIVTKTNSQDIQHSFDEWYKTSGFNTIRKSRFLFEQ